MKIAFEIAPRVQLSLDVDPCAESIPIESVSISDVMGLFDLWVEQDGTTPQILYVKIQGLQRYIAAIQRDLVPKTDGGEAP